MPPSSATIVGSAGATSVMLREATSEPSIRPAKTAITPRSTPFASVAPAAFEATAVTETSLPMGVPASAPNPAIVATNDAFGAGNDAIVATNAKGAAARERLTASRQAQPPFGQDVATIASFHAP